jgi:type II secretory pathway pseudopilin PulG
MNRKLIKSRGFTLIEVLIAAVILFSSISIVSQAFRGSLISSIKAKRSVQVAAIVPLLLSTIEYRLQTQSLNKVVFQEGVIDEAKFTWTASVIKKDGPPARLSPEDGEVIIFEDKFYLWQVNLIIQQQETKNEYSYKQITWGNPHE